MCKPDEDISTADFAKAAKQNGCVKADNDKGTFIGNPPDATKYPHIHIFSNGKTNLSVGPGVNQTIGINWDININLLNDAYQRFDQGQITGPLKDTIEWVLRSAS
ncbi:hypothetical protein GA0061071_105297 [Kosakonia oryzendophytica]|uniref:Uncharacterized protein n=1 Tax=Kosakonia oryzendophytica TaxID=1005665 RepID=A0A1C4BST1_9ENTR|nr:hypothetical protein [Kosakonia oryzendophytica]AMO49458.1 Hypothetical protein AKI40_3073 [Enterobacter sp. FY-07]WBT56089.1 hypothetical protein O9K67_12840 [Kosakonia oryzendophytica]SCC09764.1 hypothetical protein GA0061071_105297 [Kosakonia oryzendophytica]